MKTKLKQLNPSAVLVRALARAAADETFSFSDSVEETGRSYRIVGDMTVETEYLMFTVIFPKFSPMIAYAINVGSPDRYQAEKHELKRKLGEVLDICLNNMTVQVLEPFAEVSQ